MQSPRLFLLTLGALTLSASSGPAGETTSSPEVPPSQTTSGR
ncbi:MAG TPA: hypothetical protein VHR41_01110 [Gemmatimonadales bacterium]|jgi:hypothetical protein|nr:hypothetical protein [Gemmatimonadales bacterium]